MKHLSCEYDIAVIGGGPAGISPAQADPQAVRSILRGQKVILSMEE